MNLLLIDRDELYLKQLSTELKKNNLYVLTANGSGTALKILKETHIDLIISATESKASQALYLVLSIKGRYPDTPLILLSEKNSDINFNTAMLIGADELVPRNNNFAQLYSVISRYNA
ncbi:MAG: response regulator [Bacteroidia bacterium]|nr:response regulator [Bacteroidia bacterium]